MSIATKAETIHATAHRISVPRPRWMDASEADYADFFRLEFAPVVRTAYLIVHDQSAAEDLAQDAFTQLLVSWKKIAQYERPGAWVRRVAIRMAVRHAQREQMRAQLLRWIAPPARMAGTDLDLVRAIKSLPPRQRAVVALHYYEDRPLTEIAAVLGCSHSTAKVHLFNARRKLADMLGETHREADHVA